MRTQSAAIAALLTVALLAGACADAAAADRDRADSSALQLTEIALSEQCTVPSVAETDPAGLRRLSNKHEPALERYVGSLPQSKLDQLALALQEARQRFGVEQRVSALMRRVLWLLLQQDGCTS